MASTASTSWLSSLLAFCAILCLSVPVNALYFYIDGRQPKCFFEELPKDTLVVGTYSTEVINQQSNTYSVDSNLKMLITVDETFDNDHRVVSKRDAHSGRFTFSAADAGQHKICLTAETNAATGGWLSGAPAGAVKVTLDMAIGETSKIETEDKGKIQDIVQKVKDLNGRLQDIRREQVFQREREAEFRDQSEATNSRVVRWTLIQMAVLSAACAWQLSHLRSFFIKQKLT
ncbi:emp24p/erv25p- protein [Aspergillus alliaceus]|uniref:Emp24/gp25L/p24 family/GOLD-domain-containing protein n=1 Tax=Petromyces alliaceus TaxID=209559 RepID=A0A5N6GF25_PETAA|nr:emp24/gp25L/p24 family/GOLD-domain-containing protein [Aspergillus alliaceus]KAB8239789.1 emp24/gp25L/p24 family/GOLD-domain-containing protein [Aspergillus alliaceus]KAE8394575.1 emp24/gp25L/p24 family/GOLD-domain-containing protein [Aspergillus alliaceus]KAF5864273.1 emp24p/erv25p- protein [Aspergillus burnettii]